MKKYFDLTNGEKLEIEVWYDLGGMNYFSGGVNPRGYYLSVRPVKIEYHGNYTSILSTVFKGFKKLLLEVKRQSPKAETQAIELAKTFEPELIKAVLEKENVALV